MSAGTTGTWRIIYHNVPFKGRAEFVRLILEDAGIAYEENSENLYGPTGICDAFRAAGSGEDGLVAGAQENVAADIAIWPVMFPPILHHVPGGDEEEVYVNQTGAILRYCATRLGYMPDGSASTARADQIMMATMDLMGEVNSAFHPVDPKASYESQKEEADRSARSFAAGRLLVWLGHFEKLVRRLSPEADSPLFGKMTYADFALFHVLDAAEAQFGADSAYGSAWVDANVPTLKKWKAFIATRPNLQKYFASSRRKGWQGTSMM